MDIVTVLGVISSITSIISFILYFLDKKNPQPNTGSVIQNWKIWVSATLILVIIIIALGSGEETTGIKGNDNDGNEILINK